MQAWTLLHRAVEMPRNKKKRRIEEELTLSQARIEKGETPILWSPLEGIEKEQAPMAQITPVMDLAHLEMLSITPVALSITTTTIIKVR